MSNMDWKDCYNHKTGGWASMGQDKFNIQFAIFYFYLTTSKLVNKRPLDDYEKIDFLRYSQIPVLATRLQFTYKPARRNSKNIRFRIRPT
jgi:hypothetical protein